MELKKLSEESLTRQPEEVFDILSKLGEGSYGSVYKSIHKESRQVLAIKQVPVDTDLQEIIKEISIMQQCDSPYVVKYYGSYFKNTDLWIVMEYCGAGSVLDIMKLRGMWHSLPRGDVLPLSEIEISTIMSDTLKGLEYLHLRKKIHRDIKAGNILLNNEGHAKLADFGVAGQLTDTMAKRNTVIGTPFWMAPEVIQEIGYDCLADIWSLGITALEMAQGKAPYGEIHPMRAIFMIPTKPPPSFNQPDKWSSHFIDFVSLCLVKNPEERATASQLLQHKFVIGAGPCEVLANMISEAQNMREKISNNEDDLLNCSEDALTLIGGGGKTLNSPVGTMIQHATLVPDAKLNSRSLVVDDVESNLGTMVINEDDEDEETDEDTMKRNDTKPAKYRPSYLEHFKKKRVEASNDLSSNRNGVSETISSSMDNKPAAELGRNRDHNMAAHFQKQFFQISGLPTSNSCTNSVTISSYNSPSSKYHKSITEGDLDFLKYLTFDELTSRMGCLDQDMEREIDDLRRRYHAKRQPILDAMDQKRKRQQNF